MTEPAATPVIEPRWPVALAIATVLVLLTTMPRPLQIWPNWLVIVMSAMQLLPMVVVGLSRHATRMHWLKIERSVMFSITAFSAVANMIGLAHVVWVLLVRSTSATGLELLTSSIALWVSNVLTFSLVYWLLDLGGPEIRLAHTRHNADWLFPQESASETGTPEWTPTYVDYLFLAFNTATAFSPTDVAPMSARAKLLMMAETMISLSTLVVVMSRAINILGS
jgi:hypothetical protein